jgi:iron complex transport system permease protein
MTASAEPGQPLKAPVPFTRRRLTLYVPLRRLGSLGAVSVALAVVVVLATSIGTVGIGAAETLRTVLGHLHLPVDFARGSAHDRIIWDIRLPRVLTAVIVGATLASSGASYQAVFRNHLADPYLIGVAAGAGLGATIAIVSPLPLDFYHFGYVALFAFVGAIAAVAVTYELARIGRTVPAATHILAGVAVSSAASAATSLLMVLHEDKIYVIFAWLYGDFTTASWPKFWAVVPYVSGTWAVLLLLAHQLNVLQLGDEEAKTLGVRVELLKVVTIAAASLATAVCVAVSGLIGFVGLVVPHVCRMLIGPDNRMVLPMSMLLGAIFVTIADLGARTLLSPQELPVGVLTAFIGAPFFLMLLRRNRKLVAAL